MSLPGGPDGSRPTPASAYAAAGVDIEAQETGLRRIKALARSTFTPGVLSDLGLFGGLFRPDLVGLREPILVASADGVGTKLAVARRAGNFATVGRDLVNHCVNDILVQGAAPLFFLDYVGAGVLEPDAFVALVGGVADGCRENGCALLGGETAEMPGFYAPGDYELVGFIVGMVDRPRLIDGSRVEPGDLLLGLPSAGLHTNGYSLARRILFERHRLELDDRLPGGASDRTVGDWLLAPHLSYLAALRPHLADPALHGLAHITGGGLVDNVPRILRPGLTARIDPRRWPQPEIFTALGRLGAVDPAEMYRVFNMGIGMVAVVAEDAAPRLRDALAAAAGDCWTIGEIAATPRADAAPAVELR